MLTNLFNRLKRWWNPNASDKFEYIGVDMASGVDYTIFFYCHEGNCNNDAADGNIMCEEHKSTELEEKQKKFSQFWADSIEAHLQRETERLLTNGIENDKADEDLCFHGFSYRIIKDDNVVHVPVGSLIIREGI